MYRIHEKNGTDKNEIFYSPINMNNLPKYLDDKPIKYENVYSDVINYKNLDKNNELLLNNSMKSFIKSSFFLKELRLSDFYENNKWIYDLSNKNNKNKILELNNIPYHNYIEAILIHIIYFIIVYYLYKYLFWFFIFNFIIHAIMAWNDYLSILYKNKSKLFNNSLSNKNI